MFIQIHTYLKSHNEPWNTWLLNILNFYINLKYRKVIDKQYGILAYKVNNHWYVCIGQHRFASFDSNKE
jgi:hypothetical protein